MSYDPMRALVGMERVHGGAAREAMERNPGAAAVVAIREGITAPGEEPQIKPKIREKEARRHGDMTEEWRPIKGYDGLYLISASGAIYSNYTQRIMRQTINKKGYKAVSLCKDGKRKVREVHRIIAETFLENTIDGYAEVNHKDGIKTNNALENLEWVTKGGNLQHAYRKLNRKTAGKPIRCIDTGAEYASAADAGRSTGINATAIRQVLCGIKKHAGGRQWENI